MVPSNFKNPAKESTLLKDLACTLGSGLDSFSSEELKRLFRHLPDAAETLQLMQRSGFDGFRFHSIVVRQENKPILFLPLCEASFNLSTFLDGGLKKIMAALAWLLPGLFCPRILGVGLVEGEWGAIGWDPE